MSPSDDPDPEALGAWFAPRLREELGELSVNTEQTRDDRKPVTLDQQSVGRLSRMDALQGQAMAAALQARRDARRLALKAALQRIAEGEFGYCDQCGAYVGDRRLELDPAVSLCIDCAR